MYVCMCVVLLYEGAMHPLQIPSMLRANTSVTLNLNSSRPHSSVSVSFVVFPSKVATFLPSTVTFDQRGVGAGDGDASLSASVTLVLLPQSRSNNVDMSTSMCHIDSLVQITPRYSPIPDERRLCGCMAVNSPPFHNLCILVVIIIVSFDSRFDINCRFLFRCSWRVTDLSICFPTVVLDSSS